MAIEAGVPIVPVVSIGAQEAQLFLIRGERLARLLGLTSLEYKIGRTRVLPITFGFPFGFSILAVRLNVPLPTKIVTPRVLPAIDIATRFGVDPDVDEVDAYVRTVMQAALDEMSRHRRLPILG